MRSMMSLVKTLFFKSPYFLQNLVISLLNTNLYRMRHSGKYQYYRDYYAKSDQLNENDLDLESKRRLKVFLEYATKNSSWFKSYSEKDLNSFPILEKKDILENLEKIKTINESDGIESLTGGTTGASMKVIYTKEDMQERFAILDHFRESFGYKLGKRTAWFSGKKIVVPQDILKGVCYRDDYINKIRFFSTYDFSVKNFDIYWAALNNFKPEFIVGYPSAVYEICLIAKQRGLKPNFNVKVYFPTAETVLPNHREVINQVLGCKVINQYASSEGAPFILECNNGNLHIHSLTGIFEYKYPNTENREVLVTSFTTRGTPLIRYSIGDSIDLSGIFSCNCGSKFPIVKNIEGRKQDYIYTTEHGKISVVNITICTKEAKGINCLQLVQNIIDEIDIYVVTDEKFNDYEEKVFLSSLRRIVGDNVNIKLFKVNDIPKEKSGKFRIVKNNLKLED